MKKIIETLFQSRKDKALISLGRVIIRLKEDQEIEKEAEEQYLKLTSLNRYQEKQ